MWEDITKAPYKSLFNNDLQGPKLWKLVKIQRVIDEVLDLESRQLLGRERLICVHGKRIVAFKTLNSLSNDFKTSPSEITPDELTNVKDKTKEFLTSVTQKCNALYQDSYPQSIFKNPTKSRTISNET